jgi:hypothetical protein
VGLVEEEKVIVPFAKVFLGGLVASGQGGGGFGGVDAGLGEVACGFGGFAESMEVLVVLRVEAANVFSEPAPDEVDEFCAAEIEVERRAKNGLESGESEFDFLLFQLKPFDEFAIGFFSDGSEVFAKAFGVGSAIVGVKEIGMDVGVAHGACSAAYFAQRALKGFGLFLEAGDAGREGEEFESGFDSPGSGAETMDAFRRGFFEAGCDGCLQL